jgi:hypothetical protein
MEAVGVDVLEVEGVTLMGVGIMILRMNMKRHAVQGAREATEVFLTHFKRRMARCITNVTFATRPLGSCPISR